MTAIRLLVLGHAPAAVARELGVGRNTLWRWRTQDPRFVAELNRYQRDACDEAGARMRQLLLQAVDVLNEALRDPWDATRHRAALRLLPLIDRRCAAAPGPTDPIAVADELVRAARLTAGGDPTAPVTPAERDAIFAAAVADDDATKRDDGE